MKKAIMTKVRLVAGLLAATMMLACSGVAFASDKYTWKLTTGGALDSADNWEKSTVTTAYDQYVIGRAANSSLYLEDNWTVNATLTIINKGNTFEFPGKTLTLNNQLAIQQGGSLSLCSGTIVANSSVYASEPTVTAAGGDLTIDNAVVNVNSGNLYFRTTSANGSDSVLLVTNGAQVAIAAGTFRTEGGAEHAMVTVADNAVVSANNGLQTAYAWNSYETGGFGGTVVFRDNSTGTFGDKSYIGYEVPNAALRVESGSAVSFTELDIGAKSSSYGNRVVVDGGTLTVTEASSTVGGIRIGGLDTAGDSYCSRDNVLCVTNGGVLEVTTVQNNIYGVRVGNKGSGNRLIVAGPGSTASINSAKPLMIGAQTAEYSGTNAVIVTDGAMMTVVNDCYVGNSSNGTDATGGLKNILEVTDGATSIVRLIRVYPGSRVWVDDATFVVSNSFQMYRGTIAEFNGSDVSFGIGSDMDFGGLGESYANAEIVFSDSTAFVGKKLRMGGSNFVMRVFNSSLSVGDTLQTSAYYGPSAEHVYYDKTIVFGGSKPKLTVPVFDCRPLTTLRFELPDGGYATDGAIVSATGSNGFYFLDEGSRSVVVSVSPECASGTYSLLKGKNATSDKFAISTSYDPSRTRVDIVKTVDSLDGVAVLQVKVKQKSGVAIIFR